MKENRYLNEVKLLQFISKADLNFPAASLLGYDKFFKYLHFLEKNFESEFVKNCEENRSNKLWLSIYFLRVEKDLEKEFREVFKNIKILWEFHEAHKKELESFRETLILNEQSHLKKFLRQQHKKFLNVEDPFHGFYDENVDYSSDEDAVSKCRDLFFEINPRYVDESAIEEAWVFVLNHFNPTSFMMVEGEESLKETDMDIKTKPGRKKGESKIFYEYLNHPKAEDLAKALKEKFFNSSILYTYRVMYQFIVDLNWVKNHTKRGFFISMKDYFKCDIGSEVLFYKEVAITKNPELFKYVEEKISEIRFELEKEETL